MHRRLTQCGLTLLGSLAILSASPAESRAFFWWNCCYRPTYTYYQPYPVYYASYSYGYPSIAYNPCGSCCDPCGGCGYGCSPYGCSPCGSGCSPCGPGGCGIGGGGSSTNPPPTYEDGSGNDSGFEPRRDDRNPPQVPDADDSFDRDTFKVDPDATTTPESTIRRKTPAPMPETEGEATDPPAAGDPAPDLGTGGETAPVEADKEAEAPSLRLPTFNLDDKITWRSSTSRARLKVRATFTAPVVARAPVDPNSKWMPVSSRDVRLVSK